MIRDTSSYLESASSADISFGGVHVADNGNVTLSERYSVISRKRYLR